MCKIVYLTSKRFNKSSRIFKKALTQELKSRKIEVIIDYSCDLLNFFSKHKTYGIALAFDFYKDDKKGYGLTLNKNSSHISKDFAYNLSNSLDILTPSISWRDFQFVNSYNKEWNKFFKKINAPVKGIFYLCNLNDKDDCENYSIYFEKIVKLFADEIIRCLRSDYNVENYRKRIKMVKLGKNKMKKRILI